MQRGDKILFFVSASYVYGLENVTLHLMKGLKEKGWEVRCVLNGWNDGVFKQMLLDEKIRYYEVKLGWLHLRKPLWTIDTLLHYPGALIKCKKLIKNFKPDILHFSNYPMPIMLYPLLNGKIIFTLHDTYHPTLKHKFIFKYLNRKINLFIGVSNHIAKSLQRLNIPQNKTKVIYNGVNTIADTLNIFEFTFDSILYFAIIGQVAPWKGHETLINAVNILVNNNNIKNFKVFIFGNENNAYGKKLKEKIFQKSLQDYFVWKGFVKNQSSIYNACNVVIVPSLSEEPCSLTIIEAMTWGKGIIVSDRGGNPELVQNNENGLVYSAEKDVELRDCMYELIQNREKISHLGNAAQQKAVTSYNYKIMTDAYVNVYEKISSATDLQIIIEDI